MASAPNFNAFLFAAAIAGIGVGGSFLVASMNSDRQSVKDIAVLQATMDRTAKDVEKMAAAQQILISLGIRVTVIEGALTKHDMVIEDLRKGRAPVELREWQPLGRGK